MPLGGIYNRACARDGLKAAAIFLIVHTAIYLAGYNGVIDTFLWGILSVISYFPVSLFAEGSVNELAGQWFPDNPALLCATYVLEGAIGASWWFALRCLYSKMAIRN
jgi:hypothetical protein